MKRLIAVLLVFLFVCTVATADAPDLSDLTYEQLVALQHYFTAEIMSRPEWKSITIPAGDWLVGVDIPEGTYSISCDHSSLVDIWENGVGNYSGLRFNNTVSNDSPYGKVELRTGWYFQTSDSVVLAPPLIPSF